MEMMPSVKSTSTRSPVWYAFTASGVNDHWEPLVDGRTVEDPVDRFDNHGLHSCMGQAHRRMLTGTPAAKVLTTQEDIPCPYLPGEPGIEALEKVWQNAFRFRTRHLIGQVAGKHLVRIQVVAIGVIPHPFFPPELITLHGHSAAV